MARFFAEMPYQPFPLFSAAHLAALAVIGLVCLSLVVFRRHFRAAERGGLAGGPWGRLFLFLLVAQQIALYLWYAWLGKFNAATSLPLQVCTASVYLCVALWITMSKRVFEVLYFWGVCGATQALLTPSMEGYVYPHFRFWDFFIAHGLILVTIFYFLAVKGWRVTLRSLGKSFLWLQVLGVCSMAVNAVTKSNYMFLAWKPDSASLMDFLPEWPWYLPCLELVALGLMFLALIPFAFLRPVPERQPLNGGPGHSKGEF